MPPKPIELANGECYLQMGPGPVSPKSRNFSGAFQVTKGRRLKAQNFVVILIFLPFTTYEKTSFTELVHRTLRNGFSGLSRNGRLGPVVQSPIKLILG